MKPLVTKIVHSIHCFYGTKLVKMCNTKKIQFAFRQITLKKTVPQDKKF